MIKKYIALIALVGSLNAFANPTCDWQPGDDDDGQEGTSIPNPPIKTLEEILDCLKSGTAQHLNQQQIDNLTNKMRDSLQQLKMNTVGGAEGT